MQRKSLYHYYYSIEERREGGAGKNPAPNPAQMRDRPTVRPLGGAEILVAVRGPSPGEGGGKNEIIADKKNETFEIPLPHLENTFHFTNLGEHFQMSL